MIEELKENWTAWGGLSEEKREFLKEHWGSVQWYAKAPIDPMYSWTDVNHKMPMIIHKTTVYRLRKDFEVENSAQKTDNARWVEYPIEAEHGEYRVDVQHYGMVYRIHEFPSIVGFGGIQYEGQVGDAWHFQLSATIQMGNIYYFNPTKDGCPVKVATPKTARFWVEA